jgi:hypothetical protein
VGETYRQRDEVSGGQVEGLLAGLVLLFASDLRSTGDLRADLTDQEVADIVWSTNAAEYWLLLDQRGWTPARYEALLVDMWSRTLLA